MRNVGFKGGGMLRRVVLKLQNGSSRMYAVAAAVEEPSTTSPPAPNLSAYEQLPVIYAIPRMESGRLRAAAARKKDRIPSIVFSQEDGQSGGHKQLITLKENEITHLIKKIGVSFFMSRLYTLEIRTEDPPKGEIISRERVLPRLVHFHAVTDKLLNVTLIRAPPKGRFRVDIPLVFMGEDVCVGIRRGGYLNAIRRTVKYLCAPELIPKFIEVDLSEVGIGETVLIKDLQVPKGIIPFDVDPNWPVCKIMGSRSRGAPPAIAQQQQSKKK